PAVPTLGVCFQEVEQVTPVPALEQRIGELAQLTLADQAGPPRDLLHAADLEPLPLLDDPDELRGLDQRMEGSGVEPGGAAIEHGDGQLAAAQVGVVDRGDLQLAAGTRGEPARDLDHAAVVEV